MKPGSRILLLLLSLCLAAPGVRGQVLKSGEIRINPKAPGSQGGPDVATAADGHFVVVWEETAADAAKPTLLKARLFDASGRPRGGEIQVARQRDFRPAHQKARTGFVTVGRKTWPEGGKIRKAAEQAGPRGRMIWPGGGLAQISGRFDRSSGGVSRVRGSFAFPSATFPRPADGPIRPSGGSPLPTGR